jgi:hypothetical protein
MSTGGRMPMYGEGGKSPLLLDDMLYQDSRKHEFNHTTCLRRVVADVILDEVSGVFAGRSAEISAYQLDR